MLEKIKKSIFTGCDFISSKQDSNGSFISLSSPDKSFSDSIVFPSLFSTTLILSSISSIDVPVLESVKARAAKFLINQKSSDWSFNYWDRNSREYKDIPYPDDLDDTMCALSALYKYDPKIFNGEVLARIVSILTAVEVEEGGPYRTWIVDEKAGSGWLDIDFVVNVNIAYFLSLIGVELPKQTEYIENSILKNAITSPYYPTDFPAFYFISRFYKGKFKEKLVRKILRRKPENALESALTALSILNLGQDPDIVNGYIENILNNQKNGRWDSHPFYTGVNPKRDRNYYAGCEALTTTFCIEALNQFLKSKDVGKNVEVIDRFKQNLDRQIIGMVKSRYTKTGRCLQEAAIRVIDKIKEKDTAYQITLTPLFFRLALGKYGVGISEDLLIKLGAANLYGWIAYTIYDDFLDEEGSVETLSVANVALRELSEILDEALGEGSGFSKYAKKVIDNIDSANC